MKLRKKIVISTIAVALSLSVAIPSFAATSHWNDNATKMNISTDWLNWKASWESVKSNFEQISLTPGTTESSLNFAWYSRGDSQAKLCLSTTRDMVSPTYTGGVSEQYKVLNGVTYYSNKVTLDNLKPNSVYYYQYYLDGKWSTVRKFETKGTEEFSFLYVGDPQIGASVGQTASGEMSAQTAELAARNDAFSWNSTLESAMNANPDVSFMISAGDQVNETASDGSAAKDLQQEIEYAGYLSPSLISSLPIATTIGNHDSMTANYKNHFNNPNSSTTEATPTKAGYDYYYTYGNTLFIFLDTNNYNVADHETLIKKATDAYPNVTWKIVTFHQDIYGSGADHSDSDGIILRTQLTALLDKYDIDVVLQGHDHTYSRSYQLSGDGTTHTTYNASANLKDEAANAEFQKQNLCYKIVTDTQDAADNMVTNPQGVLYMEANSSTGSKFYELIATQQNFIASRSQTWTPSYSVVDVTKDTLTITTYDVATGNKIDTSYTIKKTDEIATKIITLSKTALSLSVGKTYTLQASLSPDEATDEVTYATSNKAVAVVDAQTGVITAKKVGTATITVTSGAVKIDCIVTVK
jgi:hypothetical protein